MWIRGVDFPGDLIEAHRAGRLVIFVGAGASIAPPSNLPGFTKLVETIAIESRIAYTDDDLRHLDVFLGDIADRATVDIHLRVAEHIGIPSSRPNRLHEAITRLGATGSALKIVTTNFDMHLSRALEAAGLEPAVYMAPALPLGHDFDGLVYLHGCLDQAPRKLILTDRDFGQAYLSDAWATRFLERMFAAYTVLFIGYSHNDVVMSYLARGLRMPSPRFALVPASPEARSQKALAPAWHRGA